MKIVGAKLLSRSEIQKYVRDRLAKGNRSAGPFAVARLKAVVGLQAPRRRVKGVPCGWVALTRANPGAPPRRVSGCGQASIYWRQLPSGGMAFGAKREYMMILERKGHPWLHKTIRKYIKEILAIAWGKDSGPLKKG